MMDYYAKQCLKLCNHRPTSSYCLRQHISSLLNKQKAHRPKKRRLKLANLRQREENRENDFHNNKRRHERRDIDFNDFFIRQNHDSTHKNGQKPVPPYHDCKCSCNRQQRRFLLSELTITSVSFLSLTFFSLRSFTHCHLPYFTFHPQLHRYRSSIVSNSNNFRSSRAQSDLGKHRAGGKCSRATF